MYLKEFRKHIGLSQKDFGEKLELSQVTIARYETEKINPTSITVFKYINQLNANPISYF